MDVLNINVENVEAPTSNIKGIYVMSDVKKSRR